jgi:hypothetical protein
MQDDANGKPKKGKRPVLNRLGQKLRKHTWSVYDDQAEYVNTEGGSKFLRRLIDKNRGRQLMRGAK